jgi:DNA-binding transcriptional LysR family regulator
MAQNRITEAAEAIGINRTTLIEQLHRLEADLGTALFHRATADGQPHGPTRRGAALLQALATPHTQPLRQARALSAPHCTSRPRDSLLDECC